MIALRIGSKIMDRAQQGLRRAGYEATNVGAVRATISAYSGLDARAAGEASGKLREMAESGATPGGYINGTVLVRIDPSYLTSLERWYVAEGVPYVSHADAVRRVLMLASSDKSFSAAVAEMPKRLPAKMDA